MNRKQKEKIEQMRLGGKKLAQVKQALRAMTKPGLRFEEIEAEAQRLIKAAGAVPSFSTVPGYSWATCITKNEGCCHGVPRDKSVEAGDVITIDVGLIYGGFHVDTTTTFYVGDLTAAPESIQRFLVTGQQALDRSIEQAVIGNSVYDISVAMQDVIEEAGYSAVYQLTGHAVGKELHEDPQIPCVAYKSDKKHKLFDGMTIAIEPMFAMGDAKLRLGADGWTYETVDGSLTGMFEDTVLVAPSGPEILTR